jgi:hypothetical protein
MTLLAFLAAIVTAAIGIIPSLLLVRLRHENSKQHFDGQRKVSQVHTQIALHDWRLSKVEQKVDHLADQVATLPERTAEAIRQATLNT